MIHIAHNDVEEVSYSKYMVQNRREEVHMTRDSRHTENKTAARVNAKPPP